MRQFFRRLVRFLFYERRSRPCPVCEGMGKIPSWFSGDRMLKWDEYMRHTEWDKCQVCHGEGVVWERAR